MCKMDNILENFEIIPVNSDRIKIEQLLDYDNEYVYDLEVEDNSHTFTTNNILVHNSIYVRLDAVLKYLFGTTDIDWFDNETFSKLKNFIDGDLQTKINSYCANFVCDNFKTDQRRIEFKREKISKVGDYLAKKRYVVLVRDNEGITYSEPHFSYTGVDIKKNELPESIKNLLSDCVEGMISDDWSNDKFQEKIRELWDIFRNMSIQEISFIKNLNTPKLATGFLNMEKGAGSHAKAAEFYNQIITELNLIGKHELIKTSDRFHYLYIKSNNKYGINVIGYKDRWPTEFDNLFECDYEKMFDKTVMSPLKTFLINHNFANFDPSLQIITNNAGINLFDI